MTSLAWNQQEDTTVNKFLTFSVGGDDYGIEIQYVEDIIKLQDITRVPGTPSYVMGITNLRGTIIPVIDVNIRFSKVPPEYNERTCIVVISYDGMAAGMIVDAVQEVLTIPAEEITPPPKMGASRENRYVHAIAHIGEPGKERIKLLLDISRLLYDGDALTRAGEPVA